MKLLLAALHPMGCPKRPIGGVQSWMQTMAKALTELGHQVSVWGPYLPDPDPEQSWDVGLFAHWGHTRHMAGQCAKVVKISHGIIVTEDGQGADLFTSEEVRDHWGATGEIIRQPIDLDFWCPDPRQPRHPLLVRHGYYGGLPDLPAIAQGRGWSYIQTGSMDPVECRRLLRQARVVCATGRAALEAMACGAPLVLVDHRPYQGPLLDRDPVAAMTRNYSGRGGSVPTHEDLEWAIDTALVRGSLRAHVEAHHDSRKIAEELCQVLA